MQDNPSRKRRALLALILLAPAQTIGLLMALWIAPGPLGKGVYFFTKIWILALPAVWLLWVDRGRPSLSPARRGGFVIGVASGLLISGVIYLGYRGALAIGLDPTPLQQLGAKNGFDQAIVFWSLAAYLILINAALEEYIWRWFVYTRCETLMPPAIAVLAAAAFFTSHHVVLLRSFVGWEFTWIGSGGVFVGALLWSWMYKRYRSIWPGYVSHALIDAAILAIGWDLLTSQ